MHVLCEICLIQIQTRDQKKLRYICPLRNILSFLSQVQPNRLVQDLLERSKNKRSTCVIFKHPIICTKDFTQTLYTSPTKFFDENSNGDRSQCSIGKLPNVCGYNNELSRLYSWYKHVQCNGLNDRVKQMYSKFEKVRNDIQ
ncbi:unnamed protein product [Didymodactylos carnosus]|uniref:Uncharacterized protein n=1 Tax=Didymodactylos carnosus TaxID=1234261 RepID=A0A8S2CLD7_9BILA|nr:unnamed protein product [Didymodactylos carnosus]CAF3514331.1 unnamed protein product [Didymodactylos carnosus]